MEQKWFEMLEIRKRRFESAVWIPLRATEKNETGRRGYLGYKSISEKSITDTRLYQCASTRYAAVRMDTPCSVSPKFDNTSKRLILLPIKLIGMIIRFASANR